jgi:uncharacterized protein YecE (DUF72 family)
MSASLRIGTSGWHYDHWERIFYPRGLPRADWFPFYTRFFDTVEINNSFYRLPSGETFAAWRKRAPVGFCYAVKFSRYGSHLKRLTDARSTIRYFLAAAKRLGRTLGPILVQLPPRWRANPERLDTFLRAAPRRYRWAVEFRDPSWLSEDVFSILEKHRAALCIHDLIPEHPIRITTDWTYLRYHGDKDHQGNYQRGALERAAEGISGFLEAGKDVYAYFNNDGHGYAIKNALMLGNILAKRNEATVMARS